MRWRPQFVPTMASFGMKRIVGTIIAPRLRGRGGWSILWLVILLGAGGWSIARATPGGVGNALTVTVLSPNGGEAWAGGQVQQITWSTTGVVTATNPITLLVSWNGGNSYTPIATNLADAGVYPWTVPVQNTADARIKVVVVEQDGASASDESDGPFIVDSQIQVPGGLSASPYQTWTRTNVFTLTWTNPPDLSGIVGAYYKWNTEPQGPTDGVYVATTLPIITGLIAPGDGKHSIYLWLKDRAGNLNAAQRNALFSAFWYDGSAPTSSVELSGIAGNNGWYRSSVDASLSALDPDPGSGVQAIYHQLNNQPVQTSTSFSIAASGIYELRYAALDRAGNREVTRTLNIRIDNLAPTSHATINGTPGDGGWYLQPITVQLTAADDLSGVTGIRYRIDSGAWFTGTEIMLDSDGDHRLEFQAVDEAGNVEAIQTLRLPLDQTAPSTAYQPDPSSIVGDNGWYRSFITITLIPLDLGSGIANTYYRIDGGAWQAGTHLVLNQEGEHTIEFYSVDVAGNVEIPFPVALKIDTQAPPTPAPPQTAPLSWTNLNSFDFIWSRPNDRSGIAGAYYRLGTPPTFNQDGTFTDIQVVDNIALPAEGSYDLYLWLRDGAGNVDYRRAVYVANAFRYDTTPPTTQAELTGALGENNWYVGPVTVSLTAADALAGVGSTLFRVDTRAWQTGTIALISGADKHTLTYFSTDLANNVEPPHVQTVRIDPDAPGPPQQVSVSPSGWSHVNSFAVAWTSPLDLSGVAGIHYKFDQAPVGPYDGAYLPGVSFASGLQVEGEGQHTLYLWLQDFAGNVDHNQHIRLLNAARYDATAPLTTFRASGTAGSNGWYSSPVEVTLTPSDAGSGVASTRYRINGGAWITGTQFTLGYDGQHLIEYHSSDVAGNNETVQLRTMNIDATAPSARIEGLAPFQVTPVFTLRWSGRDQPGSGVTGYDVQTRAGRSGTWRTIATNAQFTSIQVTGQIGQTTYVRVRARDAAGNVGAYSGGNGDSATYINGVTNGEFETGSFSGWSSGGAMPTSLAPPPAPPPTGAGAYSALLGSPAYGHGYPNPVVPVGSAAVSQTVTVPLISEWPLMRLSFWYRVFTYDVVYHPGRQKHYDSFEVYVLSSTGVTITRLLQDGNTDLSLVGPDKPVIDLGWKLVSFDLSPYAGQTIRLWFGNFNRQDGYYNTYTYLDSVRITTPVRRTLYLPQVR